MDGLNLYTYSVIIQLYYLNTAATKIRSRFIFTRQRTLLCLNLGILVKR